MVVFENGAPKNAHYRRFRIKTVQGANDYAMMQEVLRRRRAIFRHETQKDQALFLGGLLPGMLLVVLTAAWGVWRGNPRESVEHPFRAAEVGRAAWEAKWERLLTADA